MTLGFEQRHGEAAHVAAIATRRQLRKLRHRVRAFHRRQYPARGDQVAARDDEIDQARALQPEDPLADLEFRGFALARLGEKDKAEEILSQLKEQGREGKRVDGAIAFIYLGLRDFDKSVDALEKVAAAEGLDLKQIRQILATCAATPENAAHLVYNLLTYRGDPKADPEISAFLDFRARAITRLTAIHRYRRRPDTRADRGGHCEQA